MTYCTKLLDRLLVSSEKLAVLIRRHVPLDSDEAGGPTESLAIVERYRQKLAQAGNDREMLIAANLLTTVNKGIADAVWAADDPAASEAALDVAKNAVFAAKCLRNKLELSF